MKKVAVAVLAHPDDEAFGPGGTIAKLTLTHDVYLITVTGGEAGKCSLDEPIKNLPDIRKRELVESAKILGVKEIFCLGFQDGGLSNSLYHKIASKISGHLEKLCPELVITFAPHGVTGHIDHIAVSYITTYAVKRLSYSTKLYYYCILKDERLKKRDDYFVYFPEGHTKKEITWENDVTEVWDKKIAAIKAHKSQEHDASVTLPILEKLPKKEYFLLCE